MSFALKLLAANATSLAAVIGAIVLARAIEDNAREDGKPVDPLALSNWRSRIYRITSALTNASIPAPAPFVAQSSRF